MFIVDVRNVKFIYYLFVQVVFESYFIKLKCFWIIIQLLFLARAALWLHIRCCTFFARLGWFQSSLLFGLLAPVYTLYTHFLVSDILLPFVYAKKKRINSHFTSLRRVRCVEQLLRFLTSMPKSAPEKRKRNQRTTPFLNEDQQSIKAINYIGFLPINKLSHVNKFLKNKSISLDIKFPILKESAFSFVKMSKKGLKEQPCCNAREHCQYTPHDLGRENND